MKEIINFKTFNKVDIRIGTIVKVDYFKEAIIPAYKIYIDFGELGIKKTSAQITILYNSRDLLNKQVLAIINFKPKQIANFMSECLILGVQENEKVTLLKAKGKIKNGSAVS